jgi:hypothetical protein
MSERPVYSGDVLDVADQRVSRRLGSYVAAVLTWPQGVVRLGVVSCVAVALAIALVQWVKTLGDLDALADKHAALTYEDREIGVGLSIVADQRAVFEARALIPPDGRYEVVTGDRPVRDATGWTKPYIGNFAAYFLLPRKPSNSAPWVICYGCDPSSLGARSRVVWTNGAGISLLRVDR